MLGDGDRHSRGWGAPVCPFETRKVGVTGDEGAVGGGGGQGDHGQGEPRRVDNSSRVERRVLYNRGGLHGVIASLGKTREDLAQVAGGCRARGLWSGGWRDGVCGWQWGKTALHLAAANGHAGAVKVLLEAGVDKEAMNKVSVDAKLWLRESGEMCEGAGWRCWGSTSECRNTKGAGHMNMTSEAGDSISVRTKQSGVVGGVANAVTPSLWMTEWMDSAALG
eukprot:814516-Rhodomonas_salina.2